MVNTASCSCRRLVWSPEPSLGKAHPHLTPGVSCAIFWLPLSLHSHAQIRTHINKNKSFYRLNLVSITITNQICNIMCGDKTCLETRASDIDYEKNILPNPKLLISSLNHHPANKTIYRWCLVWWSK